jgi:secondary thiamine-phosphate synthase enzyme
MLFYAFLPTSIRIQAFYHGTTFTTSKVLCNFRNWRHRLLSDWYQNTLALKPVRRGFHLITREIVAAMPEIEQFRIGMLQVFIQHTSASLTINENADPDVRIDMETAINLISPESMPFVHTCEGPDDMPAHVKSSIFGCQLQIPVRDGHLALGTWQGIYLCEHRNHGGSRRLVLTLQGQKS